MDFRHLCKDLISKLFFSLLSPVQCKEGGFPHDLWLSVSADNVSVYKRGEPKPLETFQYEHITFFGASQLCTYKIIVDEREMYFETPLVSEYIHYVPFISVHLCFFFHLNFCSIPFIDATKDYFHYFHHCFTVCFSCEKCPSQFYYFFLSLLPVYDNISFNLIYLSY